MDSLVHNRSIADYFRLVHGHVADLLLVEVFLDIDVLGDEWLLMDLLVDDRLLVDDLLAKNWGVLDDGLGDDRGFLNDGLVAGGGSDEVVSSCFDTSMVVGMGVSVSGVDIGVSVSAMGTMGTACKSICAMTVGMSSANMMLLQTLGHSCAACTSGFVLLVHWHRCAVCSSGEFGSCASAANSRSRSSVSCKSLIGGVNRLVCVYSVLVSFVLVNEVLNLVLQAWLVSVLDFVVLMMMEHGR